ncbi:MAG: aldehyde dehydrogenase family protein [Candidatus Omnitrophica bacterium]|nr:aldehyde dehydrogenase family protein [Candidatus Omnitrophota bacterium]
MLILKNYIDGQWIDSISGKRTQKFNPANREEALCEAQASVAQDVERAMSAASQAFPAWARTPVPQRAALLQQLLEKMKANETEFVRTVTLENGKILRESRAEFQSAIKEADYQIGQGRRLGGAHVPSEQPGLLAYMTRQPLGVVSLITPWNFPLNVACRKMFPALIAGNTCVLKPSDVTPMTSALLFKLLNEAGFPRGVANFVTGRGSVIGDTLVNHPSVRAISFTGSTEVGLSIAGKVAGRSTKIQLEMGGKNPLVVLADANLERAVDAAMIGAFSCSGQWCTSTSRVIVEAPVYETVVEMLTQKAKAIAVGNGLDEAARMGPVAGPDQYESILKYIEIGKREGARLCAGGHALREGHFARGYFIAPTIFADVTSAMRIAREEIFGPVLCVMKANDFEDSVCIANETIFGLASSVFTQDLAKAQRFIEESQVGLCHVNMPTAFKEPQLEFGGIKESGRGLPEAGTTGAEFFTSHKAVYLRPLS